MVFWHQLGTKTVSRATDEVKNVIARKERTSVTPTSRFDA